MKKLLVILSFICFPIGHTCMNEYEPIYGVSRADEKPDLHIGTLSTTDYELYDYIAVNMYKVDQLDKEASDVAIAYVYLRNYKRGLQITSKLITKYPGEYNVLITHAVCLELNGEPEQALVYLKKAVAINPESHWGSEWIHVKILEQVISGNDIQGKSILGLDFGNEPIPKLAGDSINIIDYLYHLEYQLEDREYFVDTIDVIYGSLMFDYANLMYLNGEELSSDQYFKQAKKYGFKHPALEKRIEQVQKYADETTEERSDEYANEVHRDRSGSKYPMSLKNLVLLLISLGAAIIPALVFARILFRKKNG